MAASHPVTRLLGALRQGDRSALDELMPLVYDELRAVARMQLRQHRHTPTLQPTIVVHEAWMKLARSGALSVNDRTHFVAVAASAMRQVVIDHARTMLAQKRGGGVQCATLTAESASYELRPEDVIALDRALDSLDERQRHIVEMRFFAGMSESEIADALDISVRTVRRDWVSARAWLYAALYPDAAPGAPLP